MARARPLLLCAAVCLAAGCGLPSPYYLAPPGIPAAVAGFGTPFFYVESTTENGDPSEPEFRGFELYYKLYKDEASIEEGFGPDSQLSQMTGFLPLCSEDDGSPSSRSTPLMYIDTTDRGQAFTITLDFTAPGTASYEYTGPATGAHGPVEIRRSVAGPSGCKTFARADFEATDPDVSAIWPDVQSSSIYIGIYALSYGRKDLATPIYSSPVYLGWAQIDP